MASPSDRLLDLIREEEEIQFDGFSNETALQIGMHLVEVAQRDGLSVTIDITRSGQQLFHYAMPGTTRDNDEWIRRKIRVVERFHHSSFYMGTYYRSQGTTIEEKHLLSSRRYAPHGGSFPITIRGVGVVGAVTVSGLPQEEDHKLVVSVLRTFTSADR